MTGHDLHRIRTALGWSQQRMAQHLDTYQPCICRWERTGGPILDRWRRAELARLAKEGEAP